MKRIISKTKVVVNSRTGRESLIVFKNIEVTQNTNSDYLSVSMDLYELENVISLVLVGKVEKNIPQEVLKKIETISDKYDAGLVNNLVSSVIKSKPNEIVDFIEGNKYLYLNVAKKIITANSGSYFGLTEDDLVIE